MKEKVLYGTERGKPDYMEQVISTKPKHFKEAKIWARKNGFDRLRTVEYDLSKPPADIGKLLNI